MYLHHPVAGSTDVLAKKPDFSLWEDVVILEVELQERLFDTDFISLWEDIVFWQGSNGLPFLPSLWLCRNWSEMSETSQICCLLGPLPPCEPACLCVVSSCGYVA